MSQFGARHYPSANDVSRKDLSSSIRTDSHSAMGIIAGHPKLPLSSQMSAYQERIPSNISILATLKTPCPHSQMSFLELPWEAREICWRVKVTLLFVPSCRKISSIRVHSQPCPHFFKKNQNQKRKQKRTCQKDPGVHEAFTCSQ